MGRANPGGEPYPETRVANAAAKGIVVRQQRLRFGIDERREEGRLDFPEPVRLPFADFLPHRIERALDPGTLRRVGVVAIGRAMQADLCIGRVVLYR